MKCEITILFVVLAVAAGNRGPAPCDYYKCPGALKYYEEIGCTFSHGHAADSGLYCCPAKVDCTYLKFKLRNKCYAHGYEYDVGDSVIDEHLGCRKSCNCTQNDPNEPASFICERIVDEPLSDNCYRARNTADTCSNTQICVGSTDWIPTCKNGDKVYKSGEYFVPLDNDRYECWCSYGWKEGDSSMYHHPHCRTKFEKKCGFDLDYGLNVINNCAPVYNTVERPDKPKSNPVYDCTDDWYCYQEGDKIARSNQTLVEGAETCKIGNGTLNLGDTVTRALSEGCIKCECQLPPLPSCYFMEGAACSSNTDASPHNNTIY